MPWGYGYRVSRYKNIHAPIKQQPIPTWLKIVIAILALIGLFIH